jgi:transketolase
MSFEIDEEVTIRLKKMANEMRRDCITMGNATGHLGAHFGSALSLIEIMSVLYGQVLRSPLFGSSQIYHPNRDRFILSKGHGVMAMYAALRQVGVLSSDELLSFKSNKTRLHAHPSINEQLGIDVSTGSLGLGFGVAVGIALALKKTKNIESSVYVILGDGECNEGAVWESAMTAAHFGLDNLVVIVDQNGLQYDGPTSEIMSMSNLAAQWQASGWITTEIDGHSIPTLQTELSRMSNLRANQPKVVIAKTVKGKGISFMENQPKWHHNRLSEKQFDLAMSELDEESIR